jgi:hypothetical protein
MLARHGVILPDLHDSKADLCWSLVTFVHANRSKDQVQSTDSFRRWKTRVANISAPEIELCPHLPHFLSARSTPQ